MHHRREILPRQGEVACRRHDGGGGKRHVCSVSSPSVTASPRHLPLAGEELARSPVLHPTISL
ncbi:MAG: hypothetical protein EOP65_03465 [Sphingomonas sp.]|nr:MAG: hypothetical protein EOP65_03465 [Sphingomonas sp.]